MLCNILVGGADEGYLRALVNYLSTSQFHQFNIVYRTSVSDVKNAMRVDAFDLILLDEPCYMDLDSEHQVLLGVVVLTEATTALDPQSVKVMMKYQDVRRIENQLMNHFLQISPREIVSADAGRGKIVTFYSPSGGVGTTTLAQQFALFKQMKGYQVLFLTLDDHQCHHLQFSSLQTRNLSDYLVHLMGRTNWHMAFEEMVSRDARSGVAFFRPPLSSKDLWESPEDLWYRLVKHLKSVSSFDYLVVDLGKRLYFGGYSMMKEADHRVYVSSDEGTGPARWKIFLDEYRYMEQKDDLKRMTHFCRTRGQRGQSNKPYSMKPDAWIKDDSELYLTDRDDPYVINTNSSSFRVVEEFLVHV